MRKKAYLKGYRGEILTAILENGFIPRDIIYMYDKAKAIQMQRMIKILKDEGVIEEQKTINKTNYLKLTNTGRELILSEANAELAAIYNSSAIRQRIRTLAISKPIRNKEKEIEYRTSQNKYINDTTVKIFSKLAGAKTSKELNAKEKCSIKENSLYLDSVQIKNIGSYQATVQNILGSQKITNSRINGVSITKGGVYAMYSTGKNTPEWKRNGEVKMAACIQAVVAKSVENVDLSDYKKEAVIISKRDSTFVKVIESEYKSHSQRRTLMNIDFAYEHMYSLPSSYEGIRVFRTMQLPNWQAKIKEQLLSSKEIKESNYVSVSCDGYDKREGIYKLIYCIPDMTKLKSFSKRAAIDEERDKYHIYCYESQLPLIRAVTRNGKYAKLFVVNMDGMEEELYKDIHYQAM